MKKTKLKCIYCLENKTYCPQDDKINEFSKQHIIPQSLGKFESQMVTLNGYVCKGCNQFLGDELETFLGSDSLEALLKYRYVNRPKSKTFGSSRKRRVKFKILQGKYKDIWVSIQFTKNGRILDSVLSQVGFLNPKTKQRNYYLLHDDEDLEILDKEIRNKNLKKTNIEILSRDNKEHNNIIRLLKKIGIKISIKKTGKIILGKKIDIQAQGIIDNVIFRAIAKIAFEYAVKILGEVLGEKRNRDFFLGNNFNDIRNFILGKTKKSTLVSLINKPILFDELKIKGLKLTNSHLITLEWDMGKTKIYGKISLYNEYTYQVIICPNFKGLWFPIGSGHAFDLINRKVTELTAVSSLFLQKFIYGDLPKSKKKVK